MSHPETFSLPRLCRDSHAFLQAVVRDDGLFPYSTRPHGGGYVNDFGHPAAIRYSINSLLGLCAWARRSADGDVTETIRLVETFLKNHGERIEAPADLGLTLLLLAEGDLASTGRARDTLDRIRAMVRSETPTGQTMQDVSWLLWGLCGAASAGMDEARHLAEELGETILGRFVHAESLFPRHALTRWRGDVVSFGALTYFLRGMHELSSLTGDPRAARAFERGVGAICAIQGPLGEWPWLISVRRRITLDPYPVFAVHQDSMSMLFLLPALERGLEVHGSTARSFAWVLGRNELRTPMYEHDPFVAYRSIERAERFPRARRYLRAIPRSISGLAARGTREDRVRLNPECRSYHVGWILYVWSGRDEVPTASRDVAGTP
jgi:hypothetical protein